MLHFLKKQDVFISTIKCCLTDGSLHLPVYSHNSQRHKILMPLLDYISCATNDEGKRENSHVQHFIARLMAGIRGQRHCEADYCSVLAQQQNLLQTARLKRMFVKALALTVAKWVHIGN
mmetsp:Transcript_32888/g.49630  ORF Transcript_32888/g.49630 Transcript_32888/m.49630 type:complete len:119 (-) Transcript_32888:1026-1382(-)